MAELSDADVFGTKQLSDADVMGGMGGPTTPKPSLWQRIKDAAPQVGHDLATGTGYVVKGAGDLAGLVTNPIDYALNRTGLPQRVLGHPLSENLGADTQHALGFSDGTTPAQRIEGELISGSVGGLGGSRVAANLATRFAPGVTSAALAEMGASPMVDALAGGTSGAAAQGAQEAGLPWWAQMAAGFGGGLVGGAAGMRVGHGAPAPHTAEPLVEGALDGGAPATDYDTMMQTLRAAGASPDQFSSPDIAAQMAARVEAARGRPTVAMNDPALAMADRVQAGQADPSWMPQQPARVLPDDVVMTAAPEGLIRSDDPGAQLGVERKRAGDDHVLGLANDAVAQDPVMGEILSSNLSPQAKIATVWERLSKQHGDSAPAPKQPWRMSAPPGEQIDGLYSGRSEPNRGGTSVGDFEDQSARTSPTNGQREAGTRQEAPMGTGGSDRLFRHVSDDPEGRPGFWEDRARQMGDDAFAKAQADLEAEWAARREAQAQQARSAGPRMERERTATGTDPHDIYGGKYDQRPHQADGTWHTTPEGFVAGKESRPVAFRTAKEAAIFAAKNKLGGDFELRNWGGPKNNTRVVLGRREGSRYGMPAEPNAPRPPEDISGRMIEGPQGPPVAPQQAEPAPVAPEPAPAADAAPEPIPQPVQQQQAQVRPPRRPDDALTVIARHGGLRDDEGHNLRKGGREMGQYAPGGGHVFRKNGMSVDQAGELLHEQGFFPAGRPTEAEVLDLLHRSEFEPVYRPEEQATAHERAASEANAAWEENSRAELRGVAEEHDEPHPSPEAERHMMDLMASGSSPHEAYRAHAEMEVQRYLDSVDHAGEEDYGGADHGTDTGRDSPSAGAGGGPEDTGTRPGGSDGEPARAGQDGRPAGDQLDAFGQRPGDEREALERRGEGRQRSGVVQKPPGSDGGLFDSGAREGDDLFRPQRAGAIPEDEKTLAPGVERLRSHIESIAQSSTNRHYRELASLLSKIIGDDATVAFGREHMLHGDSLGEADLEGNRAFVRSRGDTETLLHEAVHLATMSRYGEAFDQLSAHDLAATPARELLHLHAEAKRNFDRLSSRIPSADAHDIAYGLSHPDEFLSMALTNPATQRFLQRGTMWGRMVDGVRRLLGLKPKFSPILDRVLKAGTDILDAARSDAPRYDPDLARPGRMQRKEAPVDAADPKREGWGKIADLALMKRDASGLVDGIKRVFGDPKAALKATVGSIDRFGSATLYSTDSALRSIAAHFNAPTVEKLADMFYARAGADDATGRTYHEAVDRATRTRTQQAYDALEPHLQDKAAMGRIRSLLAEPTRSVSATASERAVAGKLRDLLKDTLEYRRDAGEDIGEVSDGYFPRVIDPNLVAADTKGFMAAAEKLYRGVGVDDPRAAAEAWAGRVMDTYAGLDGGLDFARPGGGMGASTAKGREFGKAADTALRDFYGQDTFKTLADYLAGSARRAEQTRRFGPAGRVGSPERAAWEKAHGDASQLDVMERQIKDEVRGSGRDAAGVLDQINGAMNANMGRMKPISQFARSIVSGLHTWNMLAKMDRATVSSIGDLTMGFVRGGPRYGFDHLKDSLHEFGRMVLGAPDSDAVRYAEAIGTANDAFATDLLRARADAGLRGAGAHKLMDGFYRAIGLQQLTDGGRVAATKTGQRFLSVLADDLASDTAATRERAAFHLRELGVKNPEAFGRTLRGGGAPTRDQVLADKGFAGDYATALLRYVNQSILMPTRAEKPGWAGHPVGSLFFALQGYSYGFKKNVLDRVARTAIQAAKTRDPRYLAPASGLMVLAGLQYLQSTYLRPYIFGQSKGYADETTPEAILRTADVAGFLGPVSPVVNAFKSTKYRRSVIGSLAGPIAGTLADDATALGGLALANSPNTNTAERNAAAALYDTVVEPASDALATRYLRGPLRTAAVMATGQRGSGGVLPNDREAFVSAVAGPKEDVGAGISGGR